MGPFIMLKRFLSLLLLSFIFIAPRVVLAQFSVEDTGLHAAAGVDDANSIYAGQQNTDLGTYVALNVIRPLFALAGVVFLAFMVYAGILWMTDQGNTEQVSKAKSILVHATVGLIIMLGSYAITNLVLTALTGEDIANPE